MRIATVLAWEIRLSWRSEHASAVANNCGALRTDTDALQDSFCLTDSLAAWHLHSATVEIAFLSRIVEKQQTPMYLAMNCDDRNSSTISLAIGCGIVDFDM